MYLYFSIENGQPREPALCQLYRHTFVPYRQSVTIGTGHRAIGLGKAIFDSYSLPTVILIEVIVILIIMGIPSPTHSFTLGLNPSFSANPPYRSLSFFSFRIHCMDFPDCLLLLLSISVFLLFSFSVFTLFSCRFGAVD